MLLTKEVVTGLSSRLIKYYEEKGYKIPRIIDKNGKFTVKIGTKIKVKAEDLPNESTICVDVQCDECEKILESIQWRYYSKYVKEDGKYCCDLCATTSFYDWCYDNLSKEEADIIIMKWDDKNIDKNGNKLSPKDVAYSSNKGYWFKCLDRPEHISELKSLGNFTTGKGVIDCKQCNSISLTHPELIKYLINKEDAYKYSICSNKKIPMKCPDCGYEKEMSLNTLYGKESFGCPKCSDGKSYPEKFLFNFFEQLLNKNFIVQLNRKTLSWCKNYIFDFYILSLNCIIETHGIQHYEEINNTWQTLGEIQENDKKKELLARNNNISNYVKLDCRKSNLEWIKNNIMNSELPTLLNFKEEDIDWLKCHEYACSSLVKIVCDLWSNGIKSTTKIAEIISTINYDTVRRYLKQGIDLGWCDYDSKEVQRKGAKSLHISNQKKVICLNTSEIFNSIRDIEIKYNIHNENISRCCKGKSKYAGKHPVTDEPLRWMYYDDYIKSH